jgi:cbb3-type cytochrome oxidase maturation protein
VSVEALYLLIPLSVVLVLLIGAAFWIALSGGQFDDLEAPAWRILADDDSPGAAAGSFDMDQIRLGPGRYDQAENEGGGAGPGGASHAGAGDI